MGGLFVGGEGAGTAGVGPVVGALDHGVAIGLFLVPTGGDGYGSGAFFALGYAMEELHCHTVSVEEQDGDLVLAATGDGLAVPEEGEGVALGGRDEAGEGFDVALAEEELGKVVDLLSRVGFYQGMVVGAGGDVHLGHVGGETFESQRDDGADEAHDFHNHGEAGTIVELTFGATVVVVGGHGADAGYAVADVAYNGAAMATESA